MSSVGGRAWARVREICLAALELPAEERQRYLDAACGGDRELRAEVESLLEQHDPDFLESPLIDVERLGAEGDVALGSLRRLGAYRIVRPVGRGGMGEVYLAVQEGEGFERPVALKLVRAGMATDDVLARFRLERSILAGLSHPNLAKLIDGGATPDGLPYFVMEYVEGAPITEYCDRRALSVTDRVRLFQSVCDAVHRAPQSLVVHRDIKPSNVLVTTEGVPKLLDFGIGKVLDAAESSTELTRRTRRVLTPEYASPEQIRGGTVTTATDVHGLGLLLYELLAGRHPFSESATSDEQLARAVTETMPEAPSTVAARDPAGDGADAPQEIAARRGTQPPKLVRTLRGDLDNIVLRALRKEPERRYPSADALRSDLERYLVGLTVQARPDSFAYRASKFVRRNPWGVAAAVLALVALGTALVVPWQQNRRLMAERDKALAVQGFLLEAFGTTGGDEAVSAGELLSLQAGRVDSLYADRPELRAEMLLVLSDALERVGDYPRAVQTAERGLTTLRSEHAGDHPEVARALNTYGWALHSAGQSAEALEPLEEAVAMRRSIGRAVRDELSRSLNDLGVVRDELGEYETAEALYREALEIRRAGLGDAHRATGITASNLAVTLYRLGEFEAAKREAELALQVMRAAVGPDHQRTIIVQNNLAAMMVGAGDLAGAVEQYRDLLDRQTRLQGEGHAITNTVRNGLAQTLFLAEELDEAEELSIDVVRHARALGPAGLDHLLDSLLRIGRIHNAADRPRDALRVLDEGIALAEAERSGRPIAWQLREERRRARSVLSDWAGAAADQERFVELVGTGLDGEAEPMVRHRLHLAELLARAGDVEGARAVLVAVEPILGRIEVRESTTAMAERVRRMLGEAGAPSGDVQGSAGAPPGTVAGRGERQKRLQLGGGRCSAGGEAGSAIAQARFKLDSSRYPSFDQKSYLWVT